MINVPRRTVFIGFLSAVATVAAVYIFPEMSFVRYTGELMLGGLVSMIILSAISFYREEDLTLHDKNLLMNGFLIAVLVPSFYTAGAFLHGSQTSWSGGEIHWHADFEVLVENDGELQRKDLIDPVNFCEQSSNEPEYMCKVNDRVGTKEYHEHDDQRIHLEGVFKDREDATLSAFFETFNGKLTNTELVYPTNDGIVDVSNDGTSTVKIAVKSGVGGEREWKVIDSPKDYVISPFQRGANLDDIFIIYDSTPPTSVVSDLRQDDKYRGFGLKKSGDGYSE